MVSISNPSVTVKDVWEYANRTISNSQELADLNADVLLNSLVAQNPNPDTVASRLRNGIVNEVLGNKDKYDIVTHYAQFYEPGSLHDSNVTVFMGAVPNSTSYKLDMTWFRTYGIETNLCSVDKPNLWAFDDNASSFASGSYTGMLAVKELGILEYVPPENNLVIGSINVVNQGEAAPDPSNPIKVTSSIFDLATLPDNWHWEETYFPANYWAASSNLTRIQKSDGTYKVRLYPRPVNDSAITVTNVTGDYFTNMQLSVYEPCIMDLNFELVSGSQTIATFTLKSGELITKTLQDVNAATVPGQTTATLRCTSTIPSDVVVPGCRRFEVSTLVPKPVTP